MGLGSGEPGYRQCSRAGCTAPAVHAVVWSNPKIHTDGRTKTWLACGEHLEFLTGFLSSRGFPVSAQALEAEAEEV
ncbi:hypothetical protein GB864_07660 [Agromyces sp. MMS17-SY077]|uniref:Acetone carboxylase n=1 Tax=Agromyces seonyuensis TaxID=2662446 RepID=A0A6I4NYY9_9MICO|nr:hypothetical protein [Agromyces seonyuensis]